MSRDERAKARVDGDADREYSAARVVAAQELRALGNALVAHRAPIDVLERIAEMAADVVLAVADAEPRVHPIIELLNTPEAHEAFARGEVARLIGERLPTLFIDSVVSGPANPLSIPVKYRHEGDDVVASFVLGPAFEGAPGRAHGGTLAAIVDETMGTALHLGGVLGYTKILNIRYRAPSPIGTPLEVRARVHSQGEREYRAEAEGTDGDTVFIEAEATFVAVDITAGFSDK